MKKMKWLVSAALVSAMMMAMAGSAFAAKNEDPITGVEIDLDYELTTGLTKDDIKVDCNTSGIDSVSITSVTNTNYGKRPQVTIKVKADTSDGYYFDKEDSSEIRQDGFWSISGSEAEFKSGKRTSNSTATVTVQLPKIGGDDRSTLTVENVAWEGDSGVVTWDKPDDADSYTVRLYRNDSRKTVVTTQNEYYDFSSLIKQYGTGSYYVGVKGKASQYSAEDWTDSEEFEVTDDNINSVTGGYYGGGSGSSSNPTGGSSGGAWLTDSNGRWYINADRSYTVSNWQQIDGYWFYFDERGYVKTGWLQSPASGLWYYLSPDQEPLGHMVTNSYIGQYYVNADGVWQQ
ncbi:MAG: cell wall-binding protein [Stomatobaculum sp.]|nr:cell wall-binding protein [Stomatobaculum sp.]